MFGGNQFSYLFDEVFFATFCISATAFYDITLAIDDENVRNHVHAHCTFEIAIGVEQDIKFPTIAINERFYFLDILCLIDRDGDNFYACFVLPISIYFLNSLEFAVARFTPSCKEANDKWFAIIAKFCGVNSLTVDSFEINCGKLSTCCCDEAYEEK